MTTIKLPKFETFPVAGYDPKRLDTLGNRSDFGPRTPPKPGASTDHRGVDLAARSGTGIVSPAPGIVQQVIAGGDCGNGLVILHEDPEVGRYQTRYCHMVAPPLVSVGSQISNGTRLGAVGSTGNSTGPHLHFQLELETVLGIKYSPFRPVDPVPALKNLEKNAEWTLPVSTTSVSTARRRSNGLSPYLATLESFHPHIQYELTRRRNSAETANTYMPYVKLTSLLSVQGKDLQGIDADNQNTLPASFPSLGLHGYGAEQYTFDKIYNPTDGRSIVGYARAADGGGVIPLVASSAETDAPNLPIPGIVSINTERSTTGPMGVRGGLFKATINIKAYSVGQLNTLLKYFLRPATRVVLELGRTSSSHYEQNFSKEKSVDGKTFFSKFDWSRMGSEIDNEDKLDKMVKGELGQREFIEKYIYNNFGDYEIFIGYVVNFKLNYTKDNVYDIELLVHSVQQFELSTKNTGVQSGNNPAVSNICTAVEIVDFFNPNSYWRSNSFKNLLTKYVTTGQPTGRLEMAGIDGGWFGHVIPLLDQETAPNVAELKGPGFLISWEFFVDVVLNSNTEGLLSVFQQSEGSSVLQYLRSGLISPVKTNSGSKYELNQNEVGWNKYLRSVDPNTMIIYNKVAQQYAEEIKFNSVIPRMSAAGKLSPEERTKLTNAAGNGSLRLALETSEVGSFDENSPGSGVSTLTRGVYLNSNAIIDAFMSTDTVSMALNKLLTAMNNATQGYWNLQLLSSEEMSGLHVIDVGISKEPSSIEETPEIQEEALIPTNLTDNFEGKLTLFKAKPYLYVFNRRSTRFGQNDAIGGELLDINISSNLPNVVAVQVIAGIGGVGEEGTKAAIDIEELKRLTPAAYRTYAEPTSTGRGTCEGERGTVAAPRTEAMDPRIAEELFKQLLNVERSEDISKTTGTNKTITDIIEDFKKIELDRWVERSTRYQTKAATKPSDVELGEEVEYITEVIAPTEQEKEARLALINSDIARLQAVVEQEFEKQSKGLNAFVRQYGASFGTTIDFYEYDISRLMNNLHINKEEFEVHPFNSSNLTKTIVDLTLPGIGGIQLFQSFLVARVPNIIRRGFYVVTKVAHEFSVDKGWITKIQGRFRFKRGTISNNELI